MASHQTSCIPWWRKFSWTLLLKTPQNIDKVDWLAKEKGAFEAHIWT
jgi:hypothetical protein